MNREEKELIECAGKITGHLGLILTNCDYCEDMGMNVTETRKAVQWILTGAVRDLEKMNARLTREYTLWSPKD